MEEIMFEIILSEIKKIEFEQVYRFRSENTISWWYVGDFEQYHDVLLTQQKHVYLQYLILFTSSDVQCLPDIGHRDDRVVWMR